MSEILTVEKGVTITGDIVTTKMEQSSYGNSHTNDVGIRNIEKKYNIDLPKYNESEVDYLFSEFLKRNSGAIINENWQQSYIYDSKIININSDIVICECLIDKENLKFQTRSFPKDLFTHIFNLSIGKFVFVKILTKPGSSRIDITDAKDFINKSNFDINEGWNDLKNTNFGKPIKF